MGKPNALQLHSYKLFKCSFYIPLTYWNFLHVFQLLNYVFYSFKLFIQVIGTYMLQHLKALVFLYAFEE